MGMLLISCAFGILTLLTAIVLVRSTAAYALRLAGLAALILLALVTWRSYPGLLGWATTFDLPDRFRLDGVYIEEPNKSTNSRGAIYLWVTPFGAGTDLQRPRAFVLPFDTALQVKVTEAATKLRKRLPQLGEVVPPDPYAPIVPGHVAHIPDIEFYDLPDPLFPEK